MIDEAQGPGMGTHGVSKNQSNRLLGVDNVD